MANYIQFKVRPIVKYWGGKIFFARLIIDLIPDSDVFVEPFAGGLNVLLNKCKYGTEVAGDLNVELIHLYETVRDHSSVFLDRLKDIPYSEEVFNQVLVARVVDDPVERALNFLIKHRMSRAGQGKDFSEDAEGRRNRSGFTPDLFESLSFTAYRLQGVEFYCGPAMDLIDKYDGPNTSFYLDPPYYPTTRQSSQVYEYEMTQFQHLLLLKRIVRCEGNVVISGYDNPVYSKELKEWEKYSFETANHSGQTDVKSRRTEVVWVRSRGF